ncbi:helix-hairpin-helix domain-containing protein [Roseivirga sp. E12]|uniref:ComEA family DNA-binding protein n=1 Tax=Roseivirga sp. E12 TaxID=2819237 RepID=UPI001ABCA8D0|nr:helix-hairpin-helix domain-containing protein [Roseivirga sp. E12]MBO3698016.1 helix-hairpin-helix domain-containing protein [Roseivirga sp. E12]
MRRSVLLIISLLLLIITDRAHAQGRKPIDLQSFVEKWLNDQEVGSNYQELYERLILAYENPIDINRAEKEELINLGLLSISQVQNLLQYRQEVERLNTLYELQYVDGFDKQTINNILPFITLSTRSLNASPLLKRILSERNNYLILRYERVLEKKEGYTIDDETQTHYFGSPNKAYLRYRVSKPGDFSIGLTAEKDAGERFIWKPKSGNYGMDFWSVHLMIQNKGRLKKGIIGDYQLQFGQGLIFGSGFSVGKGSETVNTLERANIGISPYTSVVEGGFLRGLATTYAITSKLSSTVFVSSLNQDANIRLTNEETASYFSSFQLTGFHRTQAEIENRHRVNEKTYGLALNYKPSEKRKIGFIAALNSFSVPIQRSDQAYNMFEFSGNQNFNIGVYGNTYWERFNFFGELAISKSMGTGSILGFSTYLTKRIDFGLIVRNYDKNFHSIRGSSFSENSRNINESGVYWGIKYKLNRKFDLSAYYDSFRFHWLKFRVDKPSQGSDFLLRFNYGANSNTKVYLQLRGKSKEENTTLANEGKVVGNGKKLQYIINTQYQASSAITLQTRVQYSSFSIEGEHTEGYAIMQDVNFKIEALTFSSRIAIFDTEGLQNRQYAYERDVLYAFSIPGYSGQGVRSYLLFSYRLNRKFDIWTRFARTTFYDRNEIGTGLETIGGNKRTEVKFQIRYKIR